MSLIKKLAGETAVYGLSSILGRVINWVVLTPFFTRIFSTQEYAIVTDLYFYIAFLLVFFVYRMETALFRFASKPPENATTDAEKHAAKDLAFSTSSISILVSTLLLGALVWIAAPTIAEWLKYPGQEIYVRLSIALIAIDALSAVPFARLRLESRPIRFASIKVINIILYIALVHGFLLGFPWLIKQGWTSIAGIYDAENRVIYVFIANLLASILSFIMLLPLYKGLALRFVKTLWQKMLRYSLPLVIASAAGIFNALAGTTLLKTWGPGTLEQNLDLGGLYAAAAKLAVLMTLFIQAFNYAAEPFFFRQAAASDQKGIFADVAKAFSIVGSFAFLGIMLYLEQIQYFLGEDFREGLGILPLLLVANFFLGLYYNFSMSYKLTDRTSIGGYIAITGAILTLLINYILIPQVGIYAPAIASFFCFLLMAVLGYWATRKLWPVDYPILRMIVYLISAVAVWGVSVYLMPFFQLMVARIAVNTLLLAVYLFGLYKLEWAWLKGALKSES